MQLLARIAAAMVAVLVIIAWFGGIVLLATSGTGHSELSKTNRLDCVESCACKDGGECKCFISVGDKCRCENCTCSDGTQQRCKRCGRKENK